MFRFLMLISVFFLSSSAYGWSMNMSNDQLIEIAEELGDEINENEHEAEALRRSLFWLRNAKRILRGRHMIGRMRVPTVVKDKKLNRQLRTTELAIQLKRSAQLGEKLQAA